MQLTTIAFDADDTLWHNEVFYVSTQQQFAELLKDHAACDDLDSRLYEAEKRNLGHYGYGIKGFTLSMIETAIDVTEGRVPGHVIRKILDMGQEMLRHPVDLLPHAQNAVETMADRGLRIFLITKGDLLDQERKLAASNLGEYFDRVEIVSEKTSDTYTRIFGAYADGAEKGLMVGNSMRSDILPMLDAGGTAAFVPFELAWAMEHAEPPEGHGRFHTLNDLGGLTDLVSTLT